MGKFSPTKLHGDCEEIANTSTAYLTPDRKFVAVIADSDDPLARLSEADKAPVVEADETRLDLFPRSSGRVKFLEATYEFGHPERFAARLQNDLGRAIYQKSITAKKFDPETSKAAQAVDRWKH